MSIFKWLGIGEEVSKPIETVSKLYTTDKERLEMQEKLEATLQKPQLAQLETNRLLALSSNLFNSAWQPLMGWTSGACILLYWVPQLLITDYIWALECFKTNVILPFPIKPDELYNLVWLLFGFGGYSLIKKKISG